MKPILSALGRLALIGSAAFGVATAVNWSNHKSYWHGTIFRVQTVDFNMLSHTLPPKLSYALTAGNTEEIQATLNSNFGLFGMVITDCQTLDPLCLDQQILYVTESKMEWRRQLSSETLVDAPYSVLRNPPPLLTESSFANSRAVDWEATGQTNQGEVIGRVYYVRGIPPEFLADYKRWIANLGSTSGAHKYYMLTALFFLTGATASWSMIEWLLYRKRLQQRIAQTEVSRMLQESSKLRRQLREKLREVSSLLDEREQFAATLERDRQTHQDRILELEAMIAQLEKQPPSITIQAQETELLEQVQLNLQKDLEQRQAVIKQLQLRITQQAANSVESTRALTDLQQQLNEAQEQQSLVHKQLQHAEQLAMQLNKQLAQTERERHEVAQMADRWRKEVEAFKQREREASKQQGDLQRSVEVLKQQKEQLESELSEMASPGMNDFERVIFNTLMSTSKVRSGDWILDSNVDVHRGGIRQVADFLVIGKSFVVVIEAKCYKGKIQAEGDPKNTIWTNTSNNGSTGKVRSCYGRNPYKQVCTYTDSVMKRLSAEVAANRVSVYGVIVFSDAADVSSVSTEINGFYRVTTRSNLVKVLKELESAAMFRARGKRVQRSPEEIQAVFNGVDLDRSA